MRKCDRFVTMGLVRSGSALSSGIVRFGTRRLWFGSQVFDRIASFPNKRISPPSIFYFKNVILYARAHLVSLQRKRMAIRIAASDPCISSSLISLSR